MPITTRGSSLQDHILHLEFPGGGSADILLKGAHVLSWKGADQQERLYLSPTTSFDASKAVRGGIPVIFPQFGGNGKLVNHGFARISPHWEIFNQSSNNDELIVALKLSDSEETRKIWDDNKFSLIYEVKLSDQGNALTCTATIENLNEEKALEFDICFHTYFKVSNISNVRISNLQNLKYFDKVDNQAEKRQEEAVLSIANETDRIYCDTPDVIEIADENRKYVLKKDNLPDAVVWNPWIEKSKAFADLPDDGYLDFVCVEAGKVAQRFSLPRGERLTSSQTLRANL